jgi:hypothetical protein
MALQARVAELEVLLAAANADRARLEEALRDLVSESDFDAPSRSTWKRAHDAVFRAEVKP